MGELTHVDAQAVRATIRERLLNHHTPRDVLSLAVDEGLSVEAANDQLQIVLAELQTEAEMMQAAKRENVAVAIEQLKCLAREAMRDKKIKPHQRRKEVFTYMQAMWEMQGIRGRGAKTAIQVNVGQNPMAPQSPSKPEEVARRLKDQGVAPELIEQYEASLGNDPDMPVVKDQGGTIIPALRRDD